MKNEEKLKTIDLGPSSESVLRKQGFDNIDLFYNQQLRHEGKSWELSIDIPADDQTTKSFKIVGILSKQDDLSFSVSNSYSDLTHSLGDAIDTINKFLSGIGNNIPVVNASTKLGKAAASDISKLFGREGQLDSAFLNAESEYNNFKEKFNNKKKEILNFDSKFLNTLGLPAKDLGSLGLTELALSKVISPFDGVKTYGGSTATIPVVQLTGYVFHKNGTRNVIDFLIECIKNISGKTITTEGGMLGLQSPPNKYVPKLGNLKMLSTGKVDGTWSLRFGRFRYYNIVIRDFKFQLSPYRAIEFTNSNGVQSIKATNDPVMASFTVDFEFANKSLPEDVINLLQSYS